MDFIQKTKQLPQEIQEFFSSETPRIEMKKSLFLYGMPREASSELAGPVGLIFVGDFFLRDLPKKMIQEYQVQQPIAYGIAYEINQRIFARFPGQFHDAQALLGQWSALKSDPVISEDAAYRKVLEEEPWLVEAKKEQEKPQENWPKFFILDALAKYPRLNDQIISEERIRVKSEKDTVRGSVRNWLRAYRDIVGVRQHTAVERGQFLFHSENGKLLSSEERERVSIILKSLDENTPVSVHTVKQEIVFPKVSREKLPDTRNAIQTTFSSEVPASYQARPVSSQPLAPASLPVSPLRVSEEPKIPVNSDNKRSVSLSSVSQAASNQSQPSRVFNFSQSNQRSIPYNPSASDDAIKNQSMRFSSNHVLPVEKTHSDRIVPYEKAIEKEDESHRSPSKEVWDIPANLKNVVDLRSGE